MSSVVIGSSAGGVAPGAVTAGLSALVLAVPPDVAAAGLSDAALSAGFSSSTMAAIARAAARGARLSPPSTSRTVGFGQAGPADAEPLAEHAANAITSRPRCIPVTIANVVRGGMVEVGKKAPAFTLESSDGGKVKLSDYAGKNVVLYFYPRDNTPGCTVEANEFNAALPALKKLGTVVLGVSKDSIASHGKFRDKFGLAFPLLSDPDGEVLESYGAWGDKMMYGKKRKGIIRSTVLIGKDGKVKQHWPKVSVKGHVAAVIEAVKALD